MGLETPFSAAYLCVTGCGQDGVFGALIKPNAANAGLG